MRSLSYTEDRPAMQMLCFLAMLLLGSSVLAQSANVTQGGACSTADDRLDLESHKFVSDCDDQTFCLAISGSLNGTCQPRRCRTDEYPFGYASGQPLPPLCRQGQYCPDEGSGCQPLVSVGQPCQMNRDDQCAPPSNWHSLASNRNFNGSLCLRSVCTYDNASLGQQCIIDQVTYVDDGPDGQAFSNTISRDNCIAPQLYCDGSSNVCMATKALGATCTADQECQSYNCGANSLCTDPPDMPAHVAAWQYVIVGMSVVIAMASTVFALTLLHKRLRLVRYRELKDYYDEQLRLRQSITAMYAAAAERYEGDKFSDFSR